MDPQAAPPRVTKADISREKVLRAAAQIFAERGYAGTTMRAVAARVGLRAASLYYHYRSKEELIEVVLLMALQGVSDGVRDALAALPAGASARARIEAAILAHLTVVVTFGDYALATRRVLNQVPAHVRQRHLPLRDAYSGVWLDLLEAARDAGELRKDVDLHLARTLILGALNSAIEWYRPGGKSLREVAEQVVILTEGMFARRLPLPDAGTRTRRV
jgi:AcrR family transcriptional regulator